MYVDDSPILESVFADLAPDAGSILEITRFTDGDGWFWF